MLFTGFLMVMPIVVALIWSANHPQGLLHK